MVTTVVNGGFKVNHFVSCKITALGRLFDTLSDRLDIFLGNRSADGSVFEDETAARFQRLELDFTMTVLTFTAGLTFIHTFGFDRLSERFLIRNLRLTYRSLDFEFSQKSVYDNFKVQFAHTRDNGLSRFFIRIEFESGVFFREF